MNQALEIVGIISILSMMISSVLLGLFMAAFFTTKDLPKSEKWSLSFLFYGIRKPDILQKTIQAKRQSTVRWLLATQKYSSIGLLVYILLSLIVYYV